MEVPPLAIHAPRFNCQMVAGGIEGQVGFLAFGESAPTFLFREKDDEPESVVVFPSYSAISYYGAEQETDNSPMIFFLIYAKKKRGFRGKEAQRFAFQLMPPLSEPAAVTIFSRRVLIACDTAILKFQKQTGTIGDGKKKWSNVLSPRKGNDESLSPTRFSGLRQTKGKEEEDAKSNSNGNEAGEDDVYGFGGGDESSTSPPPPLPASRVAEQDAPVDEAEEISLIYEEEAMRRRDLLSSAVQTIDGLRFCGTWVTNRKMFKSLVASQDEEPIILCVTRRGLCMLKPVDSMLSAYHWSEIRSFGASPLPASEPYDAFVWMHKTVTFTVLLPVAEELETCCNNIINQALGGTFSSRPIPKYYPPSEYNPEKDADGTVGGQMLAAQLDNKPEKWTEQLEKGESWNKKHRQFLDAIIANDLHTVMEMVKDKDRLQLDLDYVDINGISGLYWAAIMGHTQIVSFLLPAGANVSSQDLTGGTPLHAAAYQGNQNIVSLLIKQGADPNSTNKAGQTPLHRAAVSGLTGGIVVCVGLVLSGCDVTAKDSRGNTALHLAALQGDANTCEALVQTEKGREVINEGNGSGRTPLHYAVLSGRKACVETLLLVGADRFVKDGSGANAIDIARREVADKEEREARAKAKGLVPTEGLQPAKDTLQLLLHWDPKKAGRLYRMKMMSTTEINSPGTLRRGATKGKVDLKAVIEEAKSKEPLSPASPAKAAKLNMLKTMSGNLASKTLDRSSLKPEDEAVKDIETDSGAVSDSLKEWEAQAQALQDRMAERAKVEAEESAKRAAQEEAEAAEARALQEAAEAEEAAAKAAAAAEAEAEAARRAEEERDEDLAPPPDLRWTDSPVVQRKKNIGLDENEDDGIRMWVAPKDQDRAQSRAGAMPRHLVMRRPGSQILTDAEKAMLSGDLTSMIALKDEKGSKVDLVGGADHHVEESPEEIAARLQAQKEADERVEALRLRLQEERRARDMQRHLDAADRFETMGKFQDAMDEYRLALEQGPCELAERKIDELETLLASQASHTQDALAEIEAAAALATEMSLGFKHLAGAQDGDKLKYGMLMARENITAEELLKLTQGGDQDGDDWDPAEFEATLEKNLTAEERKQRDLLKEIASPMKPKERIRINVPAEDEKPRIATDTSDVWFQPSVEAPRHSSNAPVENDDREQQRIQREKEEEQRRQADEDAASAAEEKKKAEAAKKLKKQKKAERKAEEMRKQEAEAEAEAKRQERLAADSAAAAAPKTSAPAAAADEDSFDKKAYNSHVRKAKAFAAENNLQGALNEYQAALKIRPGHEGLTKKVKSLKKKIGN